MDRENRVLRASPRDARSASILPADDGLSRASSRASVRASVRAADVDVSRRHVPGNDMPTDEPVLEPAGEEDWPMESGSMMNCLIPQVQSEQAYVAMTEPQVHIKQEIPEVENLYLDVGNLHHLSLGYASPSTPLSLSEHVLARSPKGPERTLSAEPRAEAQKMPSKVGRVSKEPSSPREKRKNAAMAPSSQETSASRKRPSSTFEAEPMCEETVLSPESRSSLSIPPPWPIPEVTSSPMTFNPKPRERFTAIARPKPMQISVGNPHTESSMNPTMSKAAKNQRALETHSTADESPSVLPGSLVSPSVMTRPGTSLSSPMQASEAIPVPQDPDISRTGSKRVQDFPEAPVLEALGLRQTILVSPTSVAWPAQFDPWPNTDEGRRQWFTRAVNRDFTPWVGLSEKKADDWRRLEMVVTEVLGKRNWSSEGHQACEERWGLTREEVLKASKLQSKTAEDQEPVGRRTFELLWPKVDVPWKQQAKPWVEKAMLVLGSRIFSLWKLQIDKTMCAAEGDKTAAGLLSEHGSGNMKSGYPSDPSLDKTPASQENEVDRSLTTPKPTQVLPQSPVPGATTSPSKPPPISMPKNASPPKQKDVDPRSSLSTNLDKPALQVLASPVTGLNSGEPSGKNHSDNRLPGSPISVGRSVQSATAGPRKKPAIPPPLSEIPNNLDPIMSKAPVGPRNLSSPGLQPSKAPSSLPTRPPTPIPHRPQNHPSPPSPPSPGSYPEVHKLPTHVTKAARSIFALPPVRRLLTKTGTPLTGLSAGGCNLEATLGQVRGARPARDCGVCVHKSPFMECIILEGRFGGACCGCRYDDRGKKCPLYTGEVATVDAGGPAQVDTRPVAEGKPLTNHGTYRREGLNQDERLGFSIRGRGRGRGRGWGYDRESRPEAAPRREYGRSGWEGGRGGRGNGWRYDRDDDERNDYWDSGRRSPRDWWSPERARSPPPAWRGRFGSPRR